MIKLRSLLRENFDKWNDEYWVHYSDVAYLKPRIEGSQSYYSNYAIVAIYLFPQKYLETLRHKTLAHFFSKKKYKILVKLKLGVKIFDLSEPDKYEQFMNLRYRPSSIIVSKIKELGYDGIFDDVGVLYHKDEIQLAIFDEKNMEIIKVEPNDLKRI